MLKGFLKSLTTSKSDAERQAAREFEALWRKFSLMRQTYWCADRSNRHIFHTTKATRRQIEVLERHSGCQLPSEYRRWLLEIGYGSFGPGHYDKLTSPDELTKEAVMYINYDDDPYDGEEFRDTSELTHERFAPGNPWAEILSMRGSLRICAYRDSVDYHIVLVGPLRGCVIQYLTYIGAQVTARSNLIQTSANQQEWRVHTFNQFMDMCLSQSIADAPKIVTR
jgi:hypothetical protein